MARGLTRVVNSIAEISASLRESFATVNHKLVPYLTSDLIEKLALLASTHRLDNARKRLVNAGIFTLETPLRASCQGPLYGGRYQQVPA